MKKVISVFGEVENMRKFSFTFVIIFLSCIILLTLAACNASKPENDVLEEIRSAPVVKLESAGQQDSQPIFVDNVGTTTSIADMRIQNSNSEFSEEWIYRFTYNPNEKVIDGQEIVVLFGSTSMEIDGTAYIPEDGVEYDTILQWAEGAYNYYVEH